MECVLYRNKGGNGKIVPHAADLDNPQTNIWTLRNSENFLKRPEIFAHNEFTTLQTTI